MYDIRPVDVGYYPAWVKRVDHHILVDRDIPLPLWEFLDRVNDIALDRDIDKPAGVAYLRVVDGSDVNDRQRWHHDNEHDGAVRFTAAVTTDGAPASIAFLTDPQLVGAPTSATHPHTQAPNGTVDVFTTEPHGVVQLPARPGELTGVFFCTLYDSRQQADLYTTQNMSGGDQQHRALPTLERTRQ